MQHVCEIENFADLLALHRVNPERYPYLLQSVAKGGAQARYDILFAFPGETLKLNTDQLDGFDFLQQLDERWQQQRSTVSSESSLPFSGGWFLYLGYELAGQIEPCLSLPPAHDGLPIAFATRIPAAIIFDHQQQKTSLIAEADQQALIALMKTDVQKVQPASPLPELTLELQEQDARHYLAGVERIKQYIIDGDVFQVNLSRAWQGELLANLSAADLYQRLCENNPAPFAGLALIEDAAVISSSPERLASVYGRNIETRPIAGTRPRGSFAENDQALKVELLAHPKERAEHIMLIDLERNDLGRVCEPGSVVVNELMVLETYAHVHHIVSNVRGRLRQDITPGQVIRAVFPGGTITGCPKVRCMEIIAELEGEGRGAYTGSMGYLNHDGSMDLNILIRTMVKNGNQISLRAGAGIVADSDPERELKETRAKARGLLLALNHSG